MELHLGNPLTRYRRNPNTWRKDQKPTNRRAPKPNTTEEIYTQANRPKRVPGRPVRYPGPEYQAIRHGSLVYLTQEDIKPKSYGGSNSKSVTHRQAAIYRSSSANSSVRTSSRESYGAGAYISNPSPLDRAGWLLLRNVSTAADSHS